MYARIITSLVLNSVVFSTFAGSMSAQDSLPHTWSGFYAGVNAGLVRYTQNITDDQAATFNATIQQTINPIFTGGFQLGYRHQMDAQILSGVYGVEFSADFSNASAYKIYGSPYALYELQAVNKLKNIELLQAIGGISANKTLLFLAAGFSSASVSGSLTNLDGAPFFESVNLGKTSFGWSLGAGIEYAMNDKLSARFKMDVLGSNNYTAWDDTGNNYELSNCNTQAVIGLNYKFL